MNDDKITIYVATHKKATFPENSIYKPIRVGSALSEDDFGYIRDDTGDNISSKNKTFCELTATYWMLKNDKSDIIGLTHYRRYFFKKGKDNELKNVIDENDIKDMLKNNDIIVPNRTFIIKHNVEKSWEKTHIKKDWEETRKIISEIYPDYIEAFDSFAKERVLYICNMFIAKKEIFDEYYKWLFDILFELEKRTDLTNYDNYNKRLFGFMSERLFNVWLKKHSELKVARDKVYNIDRWPYNQYFMIN